MRSKNLKCIILGNKDIAEKDLFVFLYNDEIGKFRAIAKGSKGILSKFTGHIKTLSICDISAYFGPRNIIINEVQEDPDFKIKKQNLETLNSIMQIAEITDKFIFENQTLDGLWNLLKKTIQALKSTETPMLISIGYIVKFLDKNGIFPDFKLNKIDLEKKYLKFFQFLKTQPFSEIEKISLEKSELFKIQTFLKNFIEEQTQKKFTSFLA
ncbi:MAG: DNA repair protein RecO [Candidatus Gracilibacteria bacterium]|jgi:DNA repair protein RecO